MTEVFKNDRVNGIRVTRDTRVSERGEVLYVFRKELRFPGGAYFARHEAELLSAHSDCEVLPALHAAGEGWIETGDAGVSVGRLRGMRAITYDGVLLDHPLQETRALVQLALHATRACAALAEHGICDFDRGLRNFCVEVGADGEIHYPTIRVIDLAFATSRRVPLSKPPYIDTEHDEVIRGMAPVCRDAIDESWQICARALGEAEARYALFSAAGRSAYERYENRRLPVTRTPSGVMAFALGRQLAEIGRAKPLRIDDRHEELLAVLRSMTQRHLFGVRFFPWDRVIARLEALDDPSRPLPKVMVGMDAVIEAESYDPTPINLEAAAVEASPRVAEGEKVVQPVGGQTEGKPAASAGQQERRWGGWSATRGFLSRMLRSVPVRRAVLPVALFAIGAVAWNGADRVSNGRPPSQELSAAITRIPGVKVAPLADQSRFREVAQVAAVSPVAPPKALPKRSPAKAGTSPSATAVSVEHVAPRPSDIGGAVAAVRKFKTEAKAKAVSALAPARAQLESVAQRLAGPDGITMEKLGADLGRIDSVSRKELESLLSQLKALAKTGQTDARLWLAHLYTEGLGVTKDLGLALAEYSTAARSESTRLRDEVLRRGGKLAGSMLQSDDPNLQRLALKYFESVADADPAALTWLGYAHEFGLGVPQGLPAARDWYLRAIRANASAEAHAYARARLAKLGS